MIGKLEIKEHTFQVSDISAAFGNSISPTYPAAQAIDGDTTTETRLTSAASGRRDGFIFDFGSAKRIHRVKWKHGNNNNWRIDLSTNGNNWIIDQDVTFTGAFTNETFYIQNTGKFRYIRISTEQIGAGSNSARLFEFEAWTYNQFDFEFNDSVLETKAWNSSRYDGRQLQGVNINKSNRADTGSYGRTPVLSNTCRTFYLANEIVSLSGSGFTPNSVEDNTLHRIPGFSYLTIDKAITINSDNTIELVDTNTFIKDNIDKNTNLKYSANFRGFQRELTQNIPIGSTINLRALDDNIKQRSLKNYNVYFNEGKLRQLFIYANLNHGAASGFEIGTASTTDTTWQLYRTLNTSQPISGSLVINPSARTLTSKFFTGSIAGGFGLTTPVFSQFINAIQAYKNEVNTDPDRRIFVSALKGIISSSNETGFPDIDVVNNFYNSSIINDYGENGNYAKSYKFRGEVINLNNSESLVNLSGDLDQLSTFEISSIESTEIQGTANLTKSKKSNEFAYGIKNYQQTSYIKPRKYIYGYSSGYYMGDLDDSGTKGTIIDSISEYGGSYSVSILDTSVPSLLVNIDKKLEYPEDKGNKPLIILPETLHPYIKDNLIYFMAQAGFDIGDRKVVPSLNESRRNLK